MLKRPRLAELIAALGSANDAERESAVARLTLLGDLAFRKVALVVSDEQASPTARAAGLRVLAAMPGPVPVQAAAAALQSDISTLVEGACQLLGRRARESGADGARALDALTGLALAPAAPSDSRLAAVAALEGLPDTLMRPVYEALAKDTSSGLVSRAARARAGQTWSLAALQERQLGDDPALVAAAVRDEADETPITELRRLIDTVRQRETAATDSDQAQWRTIRGSLHEALARRNSRIALYDLRETFEFSHDAVPLGFLASAAAIGDAATLDSIAAAWERASADDRWYRDHLAAVFDAILRRERLSRHHTVLKKLLLRRPAAGALIALAPKSGR